MAKPILLYDIITPELIQEITEKIIETPENEPIELWLNSPGGSVSAGWSLIAALDKHKGDVNMTIMGDASSMAFFMLLFAKKVTAYDSANLLVHRAASFWEDFMNEDELKDIEQRNTLMKSKMESRIDQDKFYEITGKSFDEIFTMSDRLDVRLTANQAKEIGLIDEVIILDVAKRHEIEIDYFNSIAALSIPKKATNINNQNNNIMSKLTDLIFGEKDPVLVASIGESQFVYSKLEKDQKIKPIGKDVQPISGTFEAENKSISVVENVITAISEINSYQKEIDTLKAELKTVKENQITVDDVAEVIMKLQEKNEKEISDLKAVITAAKLSVSNPEIPKGEFKQDLNQNVQLTMREKIAAAQAEMRENKLKNKEA
jgi:ATP-dependent Clp protease, protease subunit